MNMNEMMIGLDNIRQKSNHEMRTEVSPGKMGNGLFALIKQQHVNASDECLSSEEENLIAQSTFEIRNILTHKPATTPSFMSRFADVSESMLSEQNDADESFTQDEAPRRLRIFHDITQRNAGKSNETQKVISQAQGLLD